MEPRAKKSLGQNFLVNQKIIERIVKMADLSGTELVVEIGPGKGSLTEKLLQSAHHVLAIEKDIRLVDFLHKKFKGNKNLELIHGDALELAPPAIPYVLVANIPYYITSPLLDHFIGRGAKYPPIRSTLLIQKEVAEKLCARPPDMNVLALHIQPYGTPKIAFAVGKHNFFPQPKVDSAVITIDASPKLFFWSKDQELNYFLLIHRAFSAKRKMLRSTLGAAFVAAAGIDPQRRPETLSIDEWLRLAEQH